MPVEEDQQLFIRFRSFLFRFDFWGEERKGPPASKDVIAKLQEKVVGVNEGKSKSVTSSSLMYILDPLIILMACSR